MVGFNRDLLCLKNPTATGMNENEMIIANTQSEPPFVDSVGCTHSYNTIRKTMNAYCTHTHTHTQCLVIPLRQIDSVLMPGALGGGGEELQNDGCKKKKENGSRGGMEAGG